MRWGIRHVIGLSAIVMIAGLLLWPSTADVVQASVKAGKPCTTVGKQVVKPKWTFTCKVRKGKKVWVRTARPAWERVAEGLSARVAGRAMPVPAASFDISASPTVSPAVVAAVTETVRWSYAPWQAIAPLPPGYPVAIVDPQSRDWYADFTSRFSGDNCGPGWWERSQLNPEYFHGAVCSGMTEQWSYLVLYLPDGATNFPDFLALHESVHVAQGLLMSPSVFNRQAECWLGEGMAELYAGALMTSRQSDKPSFSATQAYRRMVVSRLWVLRASPQEVVDPAYWLDVIRRSENRGSDLCLTTGIGYSLGYLVVEKLVADFGEAALLEWIGETKRSTDADASFLAVFGIEQDRWYEISAAPYVAKEASRILGR